MSVEKVARRDGTVRWDARWREAGRSRRRTFDTRRAALAWDVEVRRRRQLGGLAELTDPGPTLAEWTRTVWWPEVAERGLAPATLGVYATALEKHILPVIGGERLRDLGPRHVAAVDAAITRPATRAKARTVLSSVLSRAVERELLTANPVRAVRGHGAPRARVVRPLPAGEVRTLLAGMSGPGARLAALVAWAGLRPGEARRLTWADVGRRTLTISAAKTRRSRSVQILPELAPWLAERGAPDAPVIGAAWTDEGYKSWARRALPDGLRVYDLRHSFASRLIAEGRSVVEVAAQLGHAPTMTLSTYAHLFEEASVRTVSSPPTRSAHPRGRRSRKRRLAGIS